MFWGLIIEPKRRYTQIVSHRFHVSMAALDIFASGDGPCQVMLHFEERNYLLCTLQKGKQLQCALDLTFEVGDEVVFATNGTGNVHLTGNLLDDLDDFLEEEDEETDEVFDKKRKARKSENQPPLKKSKTEQLLDEADNYNSDEDESFSLGKVLKEEDDDEDSDASVSSEEDGGDEEEEGDEEEDDDDDEENEESSDDDEELSSMSDDVEEEVAKSKLNGVASKKKQKESQKKLVESKSPKKTPKAEKLSPKQEKTPKTDNILKGNKTKTTKEEKTPKANKTPKSDANQKDGNVGKSPKQANSPQKRTLEGGIVVNDLTVGTGQVIKPGKIAEVYYEGRLKQNNKVFDKLRQGTPFKFRLGRQEVIKGWDVGVAGMKVGGKRRIICPPSMAYGARGSAPEIPPNSTLVFEVELKNIK